MTQPRRYVARALKDVDGLSEREIADRLGVSQKTINRDLQQTVPPAGKTPDGAPYYPLGRFNDDPEYQERVSALTRDMPRKVARLQAAREFAGTWVSNPILGQIARIRTEEEKVRLLRAFDEAGNEAA